MNIENYKCVEGGHKLNPQFVVEDGKKGHVLCVTCGLVYMDSDNPEYSMKIIKQLREYNIKEVKDE